MAYKARITNFIGAHESIYRDSPAGNLDTYLVSGMLPLQQGFYGDSKACLPIAVNDLFTFLAPEQRIVGTMPTLSHSTAMAAPLARVPTIHDIQSNIIIEAPLFENLFEQIEWDSHDFPVVIPSLGIESIELFDSNVCIESLGNLDNLSDHLTEIGLDEIPFGILQSFQLSECIFGLKQRSSCHNLFSPDPDILPKIGLIQNFSIRRENSDCIWLRIDIDSKDILSMQNLLLLGQISDNFAIGSQSICLAIPSICNQRTISLPVPILPDWNCSMLSRIHSEFDKEVRLGCECLAVPRTVEFDGIPIDSLSLIPNIPLDIANHLAVKRGVCLAG